MQGPSYADEISSFPPNKTPKEGFDPSMALKKSNTKLGGIKLQKEKLAIIKKDSQISDDDETGLHIAATQIQPTNSTQKRQKDISDDEIIFSSEDNDWGNNQAPGPNPNSKQ